MNKGTNNLQDVFLNEARKCKIPVIIYLTNGFQLRGTIKGFDSFIVMLESEGKQVLVYKHSMTTITPLKPILINNQNMENN
jgi:host factor-I protein